MTKGKTTKKALFASAMSTMLCVSMLIGSTFAWFTDSATTAVNEIKSGNLKVDLVDASGNSIRGESLNFHDKDGHTNILWEPGATFETEKFRVKNIGDLAIKYEIVMNGMKVSDNKLMEVITLKLVDEQGNTMNLNEVRKLGVRETSDLMKITATMSKNAGNAYQNKIATGMSITVFATQDTVEADMTGTEYDKDAETDKNVVYVTTPDELVNAFATLKAGSTISLGANLDMSGKTITPVHGISFTLNGNNKTISNLKSNKRALFVDHSGTGAYFFNDITLKNCAVDATSYGDQNGAGLFMGMSDTCNNATFNNCHVVDCTVDGSDWAGMFVGFAAGYGNDNDGPVYGHFKVTNSSISGGYVKSNGSVGAVVGHATANKATEFTVDNVTIENIELKGDKSEKTGIVVGTVGCGKVSISNVTINNVKGDLIESQDKYYGRLAFGGTGSLLLNGEDIQS